MTDDDDDLKMIWKESVVAYSRYYPVICLEDVTNTSKSSLRISDVPAEIRNEHLQNKSLERSQYIIIAGKTAIAFHTKFGQAESGFYFFGFRDKFVYKPGGPGPCIYVHQGQGGPVISPWHRAPFSSPSTSRRATMEVF
jgi:hypothetical protein